MKKTIALVLIAIVASLMPASCTLTRVSSYPDIYITAPESVKAGEEVTIEINITYSKVNSTDRILYVWLYGNYQRIETWSWSENDELSEETFTLTYTTVITEDTTFFAYTQSIVHRLSGASAHVEVVEDE
jgi:hypothetical protein